jgi:hypothetical protein
VVKLHPRTKWRATPHTSIRNWDEFAECGQCKR